MKFHLIFCCLLCLGTHLCTASGIFLGITANPSEPWLYFNGQARTPQQLASEIAEMAIGIPGGGARGEIVVFTDRDAPFGRVALLCELLDKTGVDVNKVVTMRMVTSGSSRDVRTILDSVPFNLKVPLGDKTLTPVGSVPKAAPTPTDSSYAGKLPAFKTQCLLIVGLFIGLLLQKLSSRLRKLFR